MLPTERRESIEGVLDPTPTATRSADSQNPHQTQPDSDGGARRDEREKTSLDCCKCNKTTPTSSLEASLSAELLEHIISNSIPWCCEACQTCLKCGSHEAAVRKEYSIINRIFIKEFSEDLNVFVSFSGLQRVLWKLW